MIIKSIKILRKTFDSKEIGDKMKIQNKIKNMAFAALFTGILAVISQIYIPFLLPLTFQIFAVALCGYTLGTKWGTASVAVYILLGCLGLPVFSGFKGGFTVLFEMTGGFIIGFVPLVILCGLASNKKKSIKIILSLLGLFLCHLWGIVQFSFLSKSNFLLSVVTVSLPYIVKDILLLSAADYISKLIKERF